MFRHDGRTFRSLSNSAGGDVSHETVFHYRQRDDLVWATYEGGAVRMCRYEAWRWTDAAERNGESVIEETFVEDIPS